MPDVVTDAVGTLFPDDPPRFLARTPHGYHDVALIEADLRAAGFSAFELATVEKQSDAPTAARCRRCLLPGHPSAQRDQARDPAALEAATARAAEAIARAFGEGRSPGRSRPRYRHGADVGARARQAMTASAGRLVSRRPRPGRSRDPTG